MLKTLEILSHFDWTVLPRVTLETLYHADWKTARKGGAWGIAKEAFASVAGLNSWPFFVPISGGWSGAQIARVLHGHGIAMWGVAYANGEMFFRVRRRQAAWAQYVMRRAGVPLLHRQFTETR